MEPRAVRLHAMPTDPWAPLRRVRRRFSSELVVDVEQCCNILKGVFAIMCSAVDD